MAIVRKSLDQVRRNGRANLAKLTATTEADIARHQLEDEGIAALPLVQPQDIRAKLNLTQAQFAEAIHVPLATLRNWEQGRGRMEPAVVSLFTILMKNPKAALAALSGRKAISRLLQKS